MAEMAGGEQQSASLCLRNFGEWHMHRHLVPIEIGIESRADQRMKLNSVAFNQAGLECLDAQPVQGRGAIEQDKALEKHLGQQIPDQRIAPFDHAFGLSWMSGERSIKQCTDQKRFEEFAGHVLWQPTFMESQRWPDDNHGATRIIDALAQQVVAEASMFAMPQIGQALERLPTRIDDGFPGMGIVKERITGLLQQTALIVQDDLRRSHLQKTLQPEIAADETTVQLVQVRRGDPTTIKGKHRSKFGGKHRNAGEDHPARMLARGAEC